MPYKKISNNEFEEVSEARIRTINLQELESNLMMAKQKEKEMNEKKEYFLSLKPSILPKYQEDFDMIFNHLDSRLSMMGSNANDLDNLIKELKKL